MKQHSQRAQRVADQIQRELAELLRDEVQGPARRPGDDHRRSRCRATSRTRRCSSRISPAASTPTRPCSALQRTAGFLRSELAHRLQLYSVPQLHFAYDESIERGMRLSQLIDEAVAADRKPNS